MPFPHKLKVGDVVIDKCGIFGIVVTICDDFPYIEVKSKHTRLRTKVLRKYHNPSELKLWSL